MRDVAALAVGDHEQPAARPASQASARAAHPGAPRRSKQASWSLTAAQAGAGGLDQGAAVKRDRAACPLGRRAAGRGRAGDRLAAAAARDRDRARARPGSGARRRPRARRSAKFTVESAPAGGPPAGRRARHRVHGPRLAAPRARRKPAELAALDCLLETRAGGEPGHLAARDRDALLRLRVDALAGAPLGDVELAEAGEADLAADLSVLLIVPSTASTASVASRLDRFVWSATRSMNSCFVTLPPCWVGKSAPI